MEMSPSRFPLKRSHIDVILVTTLALCDVSRKSFASNELELILAKTAELTSLQLTEATPPNRSVQKRLPESSLVVCIGFR